MVISRLDHKEEVEWIGTMLRCCRQFVERGELGMALADLCFAPAGYCREWLVDVIGDCRNLFAAQLLTKGGHLGGGAALGNGLDGRLLAQPLQVLR